MKAVKRMMDNVKESGSINTDGFLRALLTHDNNPDPITKTSPAEIIYGKPLSGALVFSTNLSKYSDNRVQHLWRQA